jgi:prophage tail gpP-like protein
MKPVPGKQYTAQSGDELNKIAGIAYGIPSKWPVIWNANSTVLKSDDPDLIYPGEKIYIPVLNELQETENHKIEKILEKEGADSFKLIINDIVLPVQAATITRTMDTAADGFTASIGWNPGEDERLDAATKPYGYQKASCYIAGKLKLNGFLYGVTPTLESDKRGKNLEGWSKTADIIDSSIKPPYEVNNTTLKQRALDLVAGFGIGIKWEIDDDLKFSKMTASPGDKIFAHLLKYAKQKGVLISSDIFGDLHFLRANVKGQSVGTIEEGKQQGFLTYSAKFDSRKRFNTYRAIGQSPKSGNKVEVAKDDKVPKSRMVTFKNPDATEGDLKSAAEWMRSSSLSEALTLPFKSTSWFSPNGELWEENTIVTVKSKTISIPEGFNFLIKRVKYDYNSGGRTTELSLVPPQVYSGEPIPDFFV